MQNHTDEAPPNRWGLEKDIRRIDLHLRELDEKIAALARTLIWISWAIIIFVSAIVGRVFANEIVTVMQGALKWIIS